MTTPLWVALLVIGAGLGSIALGAVIRRGGGPPVPDPKQTPSIHERLGKLDRDLIGELMVETARAVGPRPPRADPERVSVRLVPQVPVRDLDAPRSWLGGHPSLPADVPWPSRDGRVLAFLAQICLDDLPRELWRGDGPREGWLVFFLSPDDDCLPAVLHTPTRGEWRAGPSTAGGHWYRRSGRPDDPPRRPNPPRWPVDVRIAADPDPIGPDPFDLPAFDLERPELHPFDVESMQAALDAIRERVATAVGTRAAREAAVAAGKMQAPGELDAALLDRVHAGRLAAERALDAVRADFDARVAAGTFTPADVPELVGALAAIPLPSVETLDRTELLATGRRFREGPNAPLTRPYEPYGSGKWALLTPWYDLGRYALTTDPDRVPAPARAFLHRKFTFDAQGAAAAIGHAPLGHYHEDPEDDADKVVLLELHTSRLLGWSWSDANDLLFGLSRDALRAGRFDEVWISFSN